MDQETARLARRIRAFLSASGIAEWRAILFGSRATGHSRKDSDVDLIVISPSFKNTRFPERAVSLYLTWKLNLPVDFICLTPGEYRKRQNLPLFAQAAKTGIFL